MQFSTSYARLVLPDIIITYRLKHRSCASGNWAVCPRGAGGVGWWGRILLHFQEITLPAAEGPPVQRWGAQGEQTAELAGQLPQGLAQTTLTCRARALLLSPPTADGTFFFLVVN